MDIESYYNKYALRITLEHIIDEADASLKAMKEEWPEDTATQRAILDIAVGLSSARSQARSLLAKLNRKEGIE
jgi:hypothetical protein